MKTIHFIFLITFLDSFNSAEKIYVEVNDEFSTTSANEAFKFSTNSNSTRYLLYSVNPGEGFNLRRDVFIRMANLVVLLNKQGVHKWVLVLPSWGRMYHWRSDEVYEHHGGGLEWSLFFHLPSLQRLCPVIEQTDFLKALGGAPLEDVLYLQGFKEGWSSGGWEEKCEFRPCLNKMPFQKSGDMWQWGSEGLVARRLRCLSVQAEYSFLLPLLTLNVTSSTVMLGRAEMVIHGQYSEWSSQYWKARRSMRFSKALVELADYFRRTSLLSDDVTDHTVMQEDWREMKRAAGDAKGGAYLGVHLRRRDFTHSHHEDIPSLAGAAKQINKATKKLGLSKVFIATDAPQEEFEALRKKIKADVFRYEASAEVLRRYKDGGVAIIDQWICAHARHFIGTRSSTFSFRIHEEREILGFTPHSTFNRFCADGEKTCEQPTNWKVIY